MVILVVFNSFNVAINLKKPDLVERQKPPFYTTHVDQFIYLMLLVGFKIIKTNLIKKSI